MKESPITWNLPDERVYDRLEELHTCLKNFPDSALALCWQHEIDHLEELIDKYGIW